MTTLPCPSPMPSCPLSHRRFVARASSSPSTRVCEMPPCTGTSQGSAVALPRQATPRCRSPLGRGGADGGRSGGARRLLSLVTRPRAPRRPRSRRRGRQTSAPPWGAPCASLRRRCGARPDLVHSDTCCTMYVTRRPYPPCVCSTRRRRRRPLTARRSSTARPRTCLKPSPRASGRPVAKVE